MSDTMTGINLTNEFSIIVLRLLSGLFDNVRNLSSSLVFMSEIFDIEENNFRDFEDRFTKLYHTTQKFTLKNLSDRFSDFNSKFDTYIVSDLHRPIEEQKKRIRLLANLLSELRTNPYIIEVRDLDYEITADQIILDELCTPEFVSYVKILLNHLIDIIDFDEMLKTTCSCIPLAGEMHTYFVNKIDGSKFYYVNGMYHHWDGKDFVRIGYY